MARRKPNNIDILVGQRIYEERLKQHMSRDRLADMLGITGEQLRKNENAKNRISVGAFVDIANALGVKLWQLLHEGGVELITIPVDEFNRLRIENKYLKKDKEHLINKLIALQKEVA